MKNVSFNGQFTETFLIRVSFLDECKNVCGIRSECKTGITSKAAIGNMNFAMKPWFRILRILKKRICYHGTLGKNMGNHGILAKIMVSLCTILHGHGILAKIMARSWQDLGKATKELAMDLGKDAMVSNTGQNIFHSL